MRSRIVLASVAALFAVTIATPFAAATDSGATAWSRVGLPAPEVPLFAGHTFEKTRAIGAPAMRAGGAGGGAPTANIEVNYTGFDAESRAAFQAAVDIWERLIVSSQVIHVNASWEPLAPGVLGSAGPILLLGADNTWYPAALAEAMCGCPRWTGAEINARFNSSFSGWYLGTDGNAPTNKYDFVTVVLHELGHGLGFISSFRESGSQALWGFRESMSDPILPMRFDLAERTAATGGYALTNTSRFPNPSSQLKTQLTDGSVFFQGTNVAATIGQRAKLYAPSPWRPGSSNSHLDETKYARGTINALMTPSLANGEVIHDPGPLTLAIFRDIGWQTAGSNPGDNDAPVVGPPTARLFDPQTLTATASVRVSWDAATDDSGISSYELQLQKDGGAWNSVTLSSATATSADVAVAPGSSYAFRVRATDGASNVGPFSASLPADLSLLQENNAAITYVGAWTTKSVTGVSGGTVRKATTDGSDATLAFNGTSVGWVAMRAPGRGIAEVWLDGVQVDTVDLYASATKKKVVVWAPTSALAPGAHTLEIRVTGTKRAAATATRVDIDAFLVWN